MGIIDLDFDLLEVGNYGITILDVPILEDELPGIVSG